MKPASTMIAAIALGLSATLPAAGEEISWWYETANPEQRRALDEILVQPFQAENPDSKVVIDYRGSELDKQLRIAMLSGRGPDVVMTPGPAFVASMAQAGQLMALDGYAEKYGWDERLLPVFLELGKYDGKLFALPKTYETLGLFYNTKMFADNGWQAPKTIPEMEALADKMLAKGIVPFAAGNASWQGTNEWYVSLVWNSVAGPENTYKALKGEIPWTSQPFVDAITKLKEWWDKGYFGPDYLSLTTEQAFATISDGRAAMAPTGTWSFQWVPTYFDGREDEIAFIGFPSAEGLPAPIYPLGIGSTFSIAANSDAADGAAAVINYIFGDTFYGAMNSVWKGEWNTPLRDLSGVSIEEGAVPQYGEAMADLASAVDKNQYGYTTWTFLPPATANFVIQGIEEVWFGNVSVEDYLKQIDETFQTELAEGKVPAIPAR